MLTARKVSEAEQGDLLTALESDLGGGEIAAADRAMLEYALKLTRAPGKIKEGDVVVLREHGFDDQGIHDICAIGAYFGFVNRIADGLGVDLEDHFDEDD